jgi:type VI secretion system protein ImpC
MPGPLSFEFRFASPDGRPTPRREAGDAFRLLVIGDFRGAAGAPRPGLAERPILPVDIDSFDEALRRLSPRVAPRLDTPGAGDLAFAPEALDDFHPDALYRTLPIFGDLRHLRERLLDPAGFEAAAAELTEQTGAPEAERPAPEPGPEAQGRLFERLLGERPAGLPEAATGRADALIARLVEPHLVRGADPERQRLLVAAVDDALAGRMRAVLHDPAFQALESAWRALNWLVTGLETGEELEIHLLDASKAELAADIAAADTELPGSALYRRLVEQGPQTPGGRPWSLIVGAYGFAGAGADLGLLAALGAIAAQAGGAFLAAAEPAVLGCRSLAETPDPDGWPDLDPDVAAGWRALRRAPAARSIGLALPRVLLRLPYGRRSDPIEAFAFEELSGAEGHEGYLWGNPAFACALLIAQAFQEDGWDLRPGDRLDLGDLPAHSYTDEDGEARLTPCAEVLLSQRAAGAVLARGVMPLMSHRNLNAVRLLRLQSLADPPAALAGPWD